MIAKIQVESWLPKHGNNKDVYNKCSTGTLHAGASFRVDVNFPPEVEAEIKAAWDNDGAFPVFRMIVMREDGKTKAMVNLEKWLPKYGQDIDDYDYTPLGMLQVGSLFRFDVGLSLPPGVEAEIKIAQECYRFPVFRMFPIAGEHK